MLVLLMFGLSCCMKSLIFLTINIKILLILPYISNYFVTSELYLRPSNTNTRKNDPIRNNNNKVI